MTSFFAAARGLHVHDGALYHALKTERGLGINFIHTRDLWCVVLDEMRERLAQVVHIGRTGAQHFGSTGVVQQCQKQVFDGDEFMALLARLNKGHMQADF